MTDTRYDVVGLGNAIVDIIAPVEDRFLEEHDIRKNGMTLIDEARAAELTEAAKDARQLSGGSGANTIVGISSFGGTAAYIGKVAEDELGTVFRSDMKTVGVPFDTPALSSGPATARCIIFVTPDGARSMNTYLGASVLFSPEDVQEETVRAGKILYLEGYLFDQEAAKAAFVHASEIATAAGRKVALTLSDSFCVERHRDSFLHLIKNHVDIVFANEDEALSLYETEDFDTAVARMQADTALAAITRSEKGSVVIGDGEAITVPAEPVSKVVDTTGAGDQYAAGFLFGISHDLPLATSAKLGHMAAAEVISHYGPRPETPYATLAKAAGVSG
ncbi:adenosine kinase [Henriciella litoralis]|uniref:adenosine kinase n=1 Tax=Henriciella litoralis TaxID=568102 RepID=UPI0009FECD85|nr:adenosine kinase [Henriciella litoralis]